MRSTLLGATGLVFAVAGGCYSGTAVSPYDGTTPSDGGAPSSSSSSSTSSSGSTSTVADGGGATCQGTACLDAAVEDASGTNYDTPTVCTSGTMWTRGDHGSSSMHPGVACIDCHTQSPSAPTFTLAGTVFPTAHEPDDCDGVAATATVVITGAGGQSYTLSANSAGNFYTSENIATPYTAQVVAGGVTRTMSAAQTVGDCNACHTTAGASGAPGRVMSP